MPNIHVSAAPHATEAGSVQFPLVKHAKAVGWDIISDTDALALRRDESGPFFYNVLRERLLRLNPGIVTEEMRFARVAHAGVDVGEQAAVAHVVGDETTIALADREDTGIARP